MKSAKWLDRLAPDSSGNGNRLNTISSSRPKGGTWGGGGFRGSKMQKSGKSTKRLYRLAPNLLHVCGFIWEWTSRLKTISPSIFQGAFGGEGVTKCKSLENLPNGWTDWHQIWYTSADSSRNGHIMLKNN